MPFLEFLDVCYAIFEDASETCWGYNLLPGDEVHPAPALRYCDGTIIGDDMDLI